MTDLSIAPATRGRPTAEAGRRRRLPPLLLVAAFAAAGVALGALSPPEALPEARLAMLLRFMASLKGAAAVGAAVLLAWRQRRGEAPTAGLSLAYGGGLALMALAPGLIWSLGPVAAGALAFHAGLILYAVAALRDDGVSSVLPGAPRRRG